MDHISIKNLGPIKEADLSLKKVNVFMGPQSSGKSTLVKAICYCRWIEKRVTMDESLEGFTSKDKFRTEFIQFHRLSNEYFATDTEIIYLGQAISIVFTARDYEINWNADNKSRIAYKNNKLIYIPAERNFVATVPNLTKYAETKDNLLSFIYDWFESKKYYTGDSKLKVLNLGADFCHSDSTEDSHVMLTNGINLPLSNASSGLHSVIPLLVPFHYFATRIFATDRPRSFSSKERFQEKIKKLLAEAKLSQRKVIPLIDEVELYLNEAFGQFDYNFTQFFIEEPEQNIFPETQKELVYHLLRGILQDESRDHQLYLTTHSPYILYALNNCMLAWIVKDATAADPNFDHPSNLQMIDPKDVGIYEVIDGQPECIQDDQGLIKGNYFDRAMKSVMNDFYAYLNYYEPVTVEE
jgi:hypothetical protein